MTSVDLAQAKQEQPRPFYKDPSLQVFTGMVLGALIGWMLPSAAETMRIMAELFVRLIAMMVGIIIFCTIVHGIATVGNARTVGRVAVKAIVYFEIVTTFALVIGLSMINIFGPGRGMNIDPHALSPNSVQQYVSTASHISVGEFLLNIVPKTAFSAFAEGSVLQVVFFSVLFAFGLLAIGDRGKPIVILVESTQQVVFKIIGYVMYLAPLGAMGAIGFTVARFGVGSLRPRRIMA